MLNLSGGIVNLMTDETDLDPFAGFNDCAAVLAFCYATCGEDGLRVLLEQMIEPSQDFIEAAVKHLAPSDMDREAMERTRMSREHLEQAAEELALMGLPIATIVAEYAAQVPEEVCPFEPNTGDFRHWHRKRSRQPFETEQEAEQNLLNQAYRVIDTNYWTSHSGKVDAEIIPTADGEQFRIKYSLAQ
jgi:hypothetical protein